MTTYTDIDAGDTVWRFDTDFLQSRWTCIWGRGCKGIESEVNTENGRGCCSLGAELDGIDEALNLSAAAAMTPQHLFEHHAEAALHGVFADDSKTATRVVDGACIFLNRPGFAGGAGCSLQLAAAYFDEPIAQWKPSVCWQLPVKVDWEMGDDDVEVATVRGWTRQDWGDHGSKMAWCCTESADAYIGEEPVVDSLRQELTHIVGQAVYVRLKNSLAQSS
ncbi:MAG: hypothetical protein EXQ63_07995 [Ilumatobacteraceae bacterium]|nr:hypothetical protein [Ilumatobacteraceae bacterium]